MLWIRNKFEKYNRLKYIFVIVICFVTGWMFSVNQYRSRYVNNNFRSSFLFKKCITIIIIMITLNTKIYILIKKNYNNNNNKKLKIKKKIILMMMIILIIIKY